MSAPPWTPDPAAQQAAVSAEIARVYRRGVEEGRRLERRAATPVRLAADVIVTAWDEAGLAAIEGDDIQALRHALERPTIEPDSPADPDKTWSHRDSGE